ncbi:hypothetical protein HCN44_003338 [Aphidius gifuensis]|uniref:Uncharacterized protein n=1 Tax=Aphidius gifuensis TaxID=684658 RepID=A0A835CUE4_APHGI|nr:uncharacterized protein LOC122850532 [Aphidius gifuensis]KAF7994248.1 hypothetical protein HCN44_003338 [Aphidius gifuensis]
MDKELLKSLQSYYICLVKIINKWNTIKKNTEKAIANLRNSCQQLRCVTSEEVDNANICKIEFMRDKLIFKINLGIEEEIEQIDKAIKSLGVLNSELKSKLNNLETTRAKVSTDDPKIIQIIEGTPRRAKLSLLLEWAMISQEYYQQLYQDINERLKSIKRNDEKTVLLLISAFEENQESKTQIERILVFTKFLIEETI